MDRILNKRLWVMLIGISGIFFLLISMWGGLWRIGWNTPHLFKGLPGIHGPLVICGFLGTFFSLERALTMRDNWSYLVPSLILLGSGALLLKPMGHLGPNLILAGSMGFALMCFLILFKGPNLFNLMFFGGSALWLTGIIIWLAGWPVFNVYLWWIGSALFTMVGQRMELAQRLQTPPKAYPMLTIALGLVFFGEVLMAVGHVRQPDYVMDAVLDSIRDPRLTIGMRTSGVGMILTALWLIRYDAAWSLLFNRGTAGYTGVCLISGYVWLGVTGVFSIVNASLVSGYKYDALVHSFFIGFTWFVIFGQSPSLVMSWWGLRLRKMNFFYVYIVLMHATLFLWIGADIFRHPDFQKWGGLLNGSVIVLFLISLLFVVLREHISSKKSEKNLMGGT